MQADLGIEKFVAEQWIGLLSGKLFLRLVRLGVAATPVQRGLERTVDRYRRAGVPA